MNGIEALRRIKAIDADVQVIMITAFGDIGTYIDAMEWGAVEYINKPFDRDELLQAIQRTFHLVAQGDIQGRLAISFMTTLPRTNWTFPESSSRRKTVSISESACRCSWRSPGPADPGECLPPAISGRCA